MWHVVNKIEAANHGFFQRERKACTKWTFNAFQVLLQNMKVEQGQKVCLNPDHAAETRISFSCSLF